MTQEWKLFDLMKHCELKKIMKHHLKNSTKYFLKTMTLNIKRIPCTHYCNSRTSLRLRLTAVQIRLHFTCLRYWLRTVCSGYLRLFITDLNESSLQSRYVFCSGI